MTHPSRWERSDLWFCEQPLSDVELFLGGYGSSEEEWALENGYVEIPEGHGYWYPAPVDGGAVDRDKVTDPEELVAEQMSLAASEYDEDMVRSRHSPRGPW